MPDPATSASIELDDDQLDLYDRQIRVWGVATQKRISLGSVLVVGVNGLTIEAIKNILLAGIRLVHLINCAPSDEPLGIDKFILQHILEGDSSVSDRIQSYLQSLNPSAKCEVFNSVPEDISSYDIVCYGGPDLSTAIEMNASCRQHNIPFVYSKSFGQLGLIFSDYGDYSYSAARPIAADGNSGLLATTDLSEEQVKKSKQLENHSLNYCELEKAILTEWSAMRSKKIKRLGSTYLLFKVYCEFAKRLGRNPKSDDMKELTELAKCVLPETRQLNEDQLGSLFCPNDLPTCVVLGGVLCQEMIRVLGRVEHPIHNFFLFDCNTCTGVVQQVGV